jgi:hypothetical protein
MCCSEEGDSTSQSSSASAAEPVGTLDLVTPSTEKVTSPEEESGTSATQFQLDVPHFHWFVSLCFKQSSG